MNSTAFYNPHGLPHTPPNITTARDLSILGRAVQDRFPKYFAYFQTRSFRYGKRTIRGHNRLLGKVEGVDGIKTGYTRLSGFNLLTSVNTDTRSVVAVVLGGRSGASRDRKMAGLIENHLSRAYAGARTAPPVVERGVQIAQKAPPVYVASATPQAGVPLPPPERKPLDLNSLRPVVASAAGASSTTTPSSTVRWQKGQAPLPLSAQAYAALPAERTPAEISDAQRAALQAKIEAKAVESARPAKLASVKAEEPEKEERPAVTGWVIQLGATDDKDKALAILETARSRFGKLLGKASPFTEKVTVDGNTLYRARFSGFAESDDAARACKQLKKSGVKCFAARG
jgi:D-alanyl-D-alanine carboxypeptidase